MTEQSTTIDEGLVDGIRKNAGLTVVSGIVLMIAGMLAVMSPFVAGMSITIMVGAMLAVGGIGQCSWPLRPGRSARD